jgi:transglutaminase-like putative cysteine protease
MRIVQTLHHLPREARDTLFLLAVIAWVIAPQVQQLPVWCSAMAASLLLWRASIAWRNQPLPSRWWLWGLLVVATGATFYTHRTLLGRDAGVTFIVVLLALKTLELRAQRDAFVVFFLGFFTLLSNFFFSQSLPIAFAMLLGLLGLLTALVNSHMPVGRPSLLEAARTAGWMALLGAPIMAILFVLFPRIAPLWGVPSDAMRGRSGLSASMQVGTIASLALDSSVAMRIRFDGDAPPAREMYFRGPVLSTFDGREWRPLRSAFPPRMQPEPNLQVTGKPWSYQVTLEANNRPWLLVLDATLSKPVIVGYTTTMTPELQWVTDQPMPDLVRYRAESYTDFRHGPSRAVTALQDYVALPAGFNPRTLQLAIDIRRDPRNAKANASQLVAAAMDRLRTGGYSYTLEPGVFGIHTADEFWFDRKQGFCEHIASSFVVLMRAMDIPARIVTGYQGGETNAVDGYWTVRQSDAHAWAEVWIAGQGWVRVDPTSAVAPARTGSLVRLEAPRNVVAQMMGNVSPQLALNLRAMWDAVNNRWNQWVLNYSQARQLDLLRNIGFDSPSWEDLGLVLICIMVAASLVAAAWTQWERHHQDPWLRLLHRASAKLAHAGLVVPDNAAPRTIATLLQQRLGLSSDETSTAICRWLLAMESWRYAPRISPKQLGTLRREFTQLPWPQHLPENPPARAQSDH